MDNIVIVVLDFGLMIIPRVVSSASNVPQASTHVTSLKQHATIVRLVTGLRVVQQSALCVMTNNTEKKPKLAARNALHAQQDLN